MLSLCYYKLNWQLDASKKYFEFKNESSKIQKLNASQLIQQTLEYAKELERIV